MKLTPSSTARRKTFLACSRSGGQPQLPSPGSRSAPNPSRLTNRSPPNKNVSSLLLVLAAARISCNPPVKTPAALAEIAPKNVLRFITGKIYCPDQRSIETHSLPHSLAATLTALPSMSLIPFAPFSHVRQGTNPPWWVAP